MATEHNLTIYDAASLELAQRAGLPLATLDGDLRKAARAKGAALLEDSCAPQLVLPSYEMVMPA